MILFAIQSIAWFVAMWIFMSFVEHQIHRNLMHRRNFLSVRLLPFKKLFEHHAILHHTHYSKMYSDEPVPKGEDHGIQLKINEGFIEALPIAVIIGMFSLQGAVTLLFVVCLHHYLWGKIHLEMHKPEGRFFSKWPYYKYLAVHHYIHHKHPDKNFNVVIPIADFVLGTNVNHTKADMEEMYLARHDLMEHAPAPAPSLQASTR